MRQRWVDKKHLRARNKARPAAVVVAVFVVTVFCLHKGHLKPGTQQLVQGGPPSEGLLENFVTNTSMECFEACLQHKARPASKPTCNGWAWCGMESMCGQQYRHCSLSHLDKHNQDLYQEPAAGWTSGAVGDDIPARLPHASASHNTPEHHPRPAPGTTSVNDTHPAKNRRFHTITVTPDSHYIRWQMQIHYYWFLKRKAQCMSELDDTCEMGGFTRILHTGQPDDLVDQIPTFMAQPLQDPRWPEVQARYQQLNRPYAIWQWLNSTDIAEDFILLSEPDHIFLQSLPNLLGPSLRPVAPPSSVIKFDESAVSMLAPLMPSKSLTMEEAAKLSPSGNSPVMLTKEDLRKVVPLWHDLGVAINKDESAREGFGWVQEMYSFILAVHLAGVGPVEMVKQLEALPPFDTSLELSSGKPFYILHYSYKNTFNVTANNASTTGEEDLEDVWEFDKRDYTRVQPPRQLDEPPPWVANDVVRALIQLINEATDNIPCWEDHMPIMRRGPRPCDEVVAGSIYPHPKAQQPGGRKKKWSTQGRKDLWQRRQWHVT